jgi:predicted dehydrogenase
MHGMAIAERLARNRALWSLAAIVDGSVAAFMRFRSFFPEARVPFYRNVTEALGLEFDAVHIVTPAPSHVAIAKSIVESGFAGALLIEKPLSNSIAEAEGLLKLMQDLDWKGRAGIDFHRRCSNLYSGVERRIRSGEYGRLIGIEYSRPCKLSMNGSHFVDLANWFMGSPATSVSAELEKHSSIDHRGSFYFDPPGTVEVTYRNRLKFALDAVGKAAEKSRGMTVRLENAELWVNDDESSLQIRTRAGTETLASDREDNALNWVESTLLALLDPATEFSPCSVRQALDSLAVVVAAHLSDRRGGQEMALPLRGQDKKTALRVA